MCAEVSAIRFSAAGSLLPCCPGRGSWKLPCSTGRQENAVPSAAGIFSPSQPGEILPDCAGRMKRIKAATAQAENRGINVNQLNKYFTISGNACGILRYWNMIHGANAEQARQDAEGLYHAGFWAGYGICCAVKRWRARLV